MKKRRKITEKRLKQDLRKLKAIKPTSTLKERIMQEIDKAMISRERYQAFRRSIEVVLITLLLVFIASGIVLFFVQACPI